MTFWPGTNIPKSNNNAFTRHLHRELPETKDCVRCGEARPLSMFNKSGSVCGRCRYQQAKARQAVKPHGGAYSKAGWK